MTPTDGRDADDAQPDDAQPDDEQSHDELRRERPEDVPPRSGDDAGGDDAGGDDMGAHLPTDDAGADSLGELPDRIIDSFLVRDGRAQRIDLHLHRTAAAMASAFGEIESVPDFGQLSHMYAESLARVPRQGEWFPLIEVRRDPERGVVVSFNVSRPAPALRTTTRLAIAAERRRFPAFKGADAEVTAADRGSAQDVGDDDALYLDAQGHVREAANGTVIGWRGPTMLVPEFPDLLPGTTLEAMIEHLTLQRDLRLGVGPSGEMGAERHRLETAEVRGALFRPDDVDELWYLNALHGITPVVSVDGVERSFDAERLAAWRRLADGWWEPV